MDAEEKKLNVKLAYGYYQNKEYKRAIELYEKLFQADPEDFNVLSMLADAYLKYGKKDKGLEAYVSTLTLLEAKGNYMKTVKLGKKVSTMFPDDNRIKNKVKSSVRLMLRDAEKKAMQHEYHDALEILENLKEHESDEFQIALKIEQMNTEERAYLEHTKKMQEKKEERKIDTGNELIDKFDRMAQNYLKNGDYDGAVETYITALKLSPNNAGLRAKLHNVYLQVSQQASGEKVWDKIDKSPVDKLEEAKRKASEERNAKIMEEEEKRARLLMEEEARIQAEYEKQEMEIIRKAADELKQKLDEAQKKENFKKEEIQRIMKEQEAKKKELLENAKREAIEKWKKQRDAIQSQGSEAAAAPAGGQPHGTGQGLMGNLNKAYEMPEVGGWDNLSGQNKGFKLKIETPGAPPAAVSAKTETPPQAPAAPAQHEEEIVVNHDTLDSLITTAFIYLHQGMVKEAMKIHNKVSEKYPDNPEVKQLLIELSKKQGG